MKAEPRLAPTGSKCGLSIPEGRPKSRRRTNRSFTSNGRVYLTCAQIDGQLDCRGGQLRNLGGEALSAYRAVVRNTV